MDIYQNIEDYNPNKKRKVLIRDRKLNIYFFLLDNFILLCQNTLD